MICVRGANGPGWVAFVPRLNLSSPCASAGLYTGPAPQGVTPLHSDVSPLSKPFWKMRFSTY